MHDVAVLIVGSSGSGCVLLLNVFALLLACDLHEDLLEGGVRDTHIFEKGTKLLKVWVGAWTAL